MPNGTIALENCDGPCNCLICVSFLLVPLSMQGCLLVPFVSQALVFVSMQKYHPFVYGKQMKFLLTDTDMELMVTNFGNSCLIFGNL